MSRQFGISYKGSKSKIADKIMSLFPQRENFYDLFMGGGAMTHCAMMSGKFKNIYSSDINWMCPEIFKRVGITTSEGG